MTTMPDDQTQDPGDFDRPAHESAFAGGPQAPASDLSAFDDDYDDAEAPAYGNLPDGKYQVRVDRVELGKSQAGDPMLKWDFIVLSGEHAGRHLFKNAVITHKSLPFVKGDLQTLGVALPKFSDLPHHLDGLLDQTLEVTQRTRGEYTNLYINRQITVPVGGVTAADVLGDEPAPF